MAKVAGKERKPERKCDVDDCDRTHMSNGYCNMHWARWRKYGDPLVTMRKPANPNKIAQALAMYEEGLKLSEIAEATGYKQASIRHLARKHGIGRRNNMSQQGIKNIRNAREARKVKGCSIPGCNNPRTSKGYCATHRNRELINGSPLISKAKARGSGMRDCSVPGCSQRHSAKGYCGKHYYRWKQGMPLD